MSVFGLMRDSFRLMADSLSCFSEDDGWAIASHIALSTLTSLFPFLIFVTALAGFFGSQELADEAARILFETWPQQVAVPIAREVHNVLTNAHGGLLTIGVVLSIYFSSSGIEALRIALNRAYDVHETRPWWFLRIESIVYVLISAFGLLTLAFFVVLAPLIWATVLKEAPAMQPLNGLVTFARFGVATVVLLFVLVVVHKFLPNGHRRFLDIWPGIAFTFVLWVLAGMAFGSYLAEFARNYVTTYAGLASVMIAILFLYMLASIFIFGGELNAALMRFNGRAKAKLAAQDETPGPPT